MQQEERRPRLPLVVSAAVLVSALCDLPAYFAVGSATGSALVTAALAGLAIILFPPLAKAKSSGQSAFYPFAAFTIWSTVTAFAYGLDLAALQNLSIFWMFLGVGLATCEYVEPGGADIYRRRLAWAGWFIGLLYAASLVLDGLGSGSILGRRSFALEALILMAMAVPYAASSSRALRWLPAALLLLIAASLSRTAMIVALLLFALRAAYTRHGLKPFRTVGILAAGIVGLLIAIAQNPVLRERFTGGDQAFQAGGVTVSLQGRDNLWSAVLENYSDSPVFGHGPGSVRALIASKVPGQTEPHNDFLRVLYDSGWVGVVLLAWALCALIRAVAQRARRAAGSQAAAPHVGALLALAALLPTFLTDNSLVYPFVMAPLAVIVGMSLLEPLPPPRPKRPRKLTRAEQVREERIRRLQALKRPRPAPPRTATPSP